MLLEYLNPVEEGNIAFYRLSADKSVIAFTAICSTVILLGCLSYSHDYTKFPKDSFPNATRDYYMEHFVRAGNLTFFFDEDGEKKTFNLELYLRDKHYKSMGMKRIWFGYTYDTYCWNDTVPSSSWTELPSLLRVFEFRPLLQAAFRFTVLFTAAPRMCLSYFRSRRLQVFSSHQNPLISKFVHLPYLVVAIQCTAEFWVTSLHQDCDRNYKYLMPHTFVLLAVSASLNMLLVIIEDIFDASLKLVTCIRFYIRVTCLLVSIILFPTLIDNHLLFLERKVCHPYVHWSAALPEYLVAIALATFVLTQALDLPNLEGLICPCVGEVSQNSYTSESEIYEPAVKYKEEIVRKRNCRTEEK